MSSVAAVVDTDVLVDHLRGHRRFESGETPVAYSVVTRCELFAGTGGHEQVRELLAAMTEIPIDRAIAESAGAIRRLHGTDLSDALIAATALQHRAPLVTRNLRDYRGIKGLKAEAPRARATRPKE